MIYQTYQCRDCNIECEIEHSKGMKCPKCGKDMWWIAASGIAKGDSQEFYSQELGLLGEQQKQYKLKHPDAEFNQTGAMKVKNQRHLDKVLSDKGMVCLTDSKEYKNQTTELLEKTRERKFNNENH